VEFYIVHINLAVVCSVYSNAVFVNMLSAEYHGNSMLRTFESNKICFLT